MLYLVKQMDKRIVNAQEGRKAILLAVSRALEGASLTKGELISACEKVNIDHNVLNMLKNAGIITSSRGKHARITACVSFLEVFAHLDEYVSKMQRTNEEERKEARVLASKQELKEAFKRAKKETSKLQAELDFVYKEIESLEAENARLKSIIANIKTLLP
jgi:DNA-binding IscR family transcriptional regulator